MPTFHRLYCPCRYAYCFASSGGLGGHDTNYQVFDEDVHEAYDFTGPVLGSGAFATVLRVQDRVSGVEYAIKQVRSKYVTLVVGPGVRASSPPWHAGCCKKSRNMYVS